MLFCIMISGVIQEIDKIGRRDLGNVFIRDTKLTMYHAKESFSKNETKMRSDAYLQSNQDFA